MGIGLGAVALLLDENARSPFGGAILTLGKQTIEARENELDALLRGSGKRWPVGQAVGDQTLFQALGFGVAESLDANAYEDATHILDLNAAATPAELCDRYDVVLDGGTLEHVFHVPHALAHMGRMVRVGGRVIHMSPSSNYFDHGFYMFSPTLFHDYYRANGFTVECMRVIRHSGEAGAAWDVFAYEPREWSGVGVGGLDDCAYLILVVATRTAASTVDRVPQQGHYEAVWRGGRGGGEAGGLRAFLRKHPALLTPARRLRSLVRRLRTGTVYGKRPIKRIVSSAAGRPGRMD